MMQMSDNNHKIYTLKEIAEVAIPFFSKYKGVRQVYIFGSYADGTANGVSDIDFVLDTDDEQVDVFLDGYILSDELCKDCWFNSFDTQKQFNEWARGKKGVMVYSNRQAEVYSS